MQQLLKQNAFTTQDYWKCLADRSGIDSSPELLQYMKWRETPAEMRQPKTQTELSKQLGVNESTLETSFLFLFQRATDEWLYGS